MKRLIVWGPVALLLAGCGTPGHPAGSVRPIGSVVEIQAPLGLPPVPVPAGNPPTAETIALGRRLYFERALSGDNTIACAACHNPATAFCDRRKVSAGVAGKTGARNSPTILNAAYNRAQFWDGRAASLEEQAAGPIANPMEMNQPHRTLVAKIATGPVYAALFAKAFGPGRVTMKHIENALASYERTLLSGNSAFDRYQYGGDQTAMSAAAIRGLAIFRDAKRGNCAGCHTIQAKFALFTDGRFHNLGAGMDEQGELRDAGRYEQTRNEADRGAFRTPGLRNVALTAPYMHDGGHKTLRDVVDFYAGGGNGNSHLDKEIHPLKLTRRERDDLIAFLEALTGESPQT